MNTFGRRVGVELVGNGASVEKMWADTAAAATASSTTMVKATATATDAQIAGTVKQIESLRLQQKEFAAAAVGSTRTAKEQEAAQIRLAAVNQRLARITGESTVATSSASAATAAFAGKSKTAERDFGKTTRGILAGSGAFTSLGRSLAFASSGFLIFASGAALIRKSIDASRLLEVTQRQVGAQLKTSGKSWNEYGARITATDLKLSHISGFTNQDLLQSFGYLIRVTGNVDTALRLNGVAADVARGRHIALSSASIALSKALGGSVTALRRLGITIPKNVKGMDALNYVAAKFAGQAKAGTTVSQKFSATLVDTEEIIGAALLPAVNRITTEFGNWLAKMNQTGRLQKDVNDAVKVAGFVFHSLGSVIGTVDKVTGSFANTLKLLLAYKFATVVASWSTSLRGLAVQWGLVGGAATKAAAAESEALGAGATGGLAAGTTGAGVGAAAATVARRTSANLPSVFSEYAGGAALGIAGTGAAATAAGAKVTALRAGLTGLSKLTIAAIAIPIVLQIRNKASDFTVGHGFGGKLLNDFLVNNPILHPTRAFHDFVNFGRYGPGGPPPAQPPFSQAVQRGNFAFPGLPSQLPAPKPRAPGPFGAAKPETFYASYQLSTLEQLAQARAALTKGTADDVAAAKGIIARIERLIDRGQLSNAAMIQALQAEAGALGTVQSAEAAAAQKRQAAAAKALQIASTFSTSVDLQIAQVQAEMTKGTADDARVLKQIIAEARKALGTKNKQGRLAALQVILQAQQQLAGLTGQSATNYTLPARLQLQLARAQATGKSITPVLLKMKAALEKALKAARGNIQKQTDIYNQIYGINQQLGSSMASALGGFKQASTRVLTAGLGLTPEQRRALRARLSQLGPHGTVPGKGVGAAGFIIGRDDRPIVIHNHLDLDGRRIADNTTRHQQRRRRRNPSQRRGPNAGIGSG